MSALQFAGKADAYLEWAHHTGFAHFDKPGDETGLVWLRSGAIQSTTQPITQLAAELQQAAVERVELATPVMGEQKATKPLILGSPGIVPNVILGVIDDGCPFARTGMRDGTHTRVWLLWDQNPAGPPDTQARYGRVLDTSKLDANLGTGDVSAYEALGMKNLRRRATHGAHVLDVLAGPVPARARVSPSRFTLEGGDGSAHQPPAWQARHDDASRAPLFFVQLPSKALDDPTGRWLARHALDGLDFIIAGARQVWDKKLQGNRLVVNLSWGPQTGPHDGSSLLERAFDQRIQACARDGITLHITLPAGNSHEARAHGQFPLSGGCRNLTWQVMPDARHPQFLEIWWPIGTPLTDVGLSVRSPDGQQLRCNGAALAQDQRGAILSAGVGHPWGLTVVPHHSRFMALLALAPTRPANTATTATPPHGRWQIEVGAAPSAAPDRLVHVYVARNAANMGAKRRSPDGYLRDAAYEASRHGRRPRSEPTDSLVRREGTLSGIATGNETLVVAGYVSSRGPARAAVNPAEVEPAAPYSSSGPATHTERNPDWALPTDESPYLRGVLAGGVRAGSAVRLTGTSAAAPQLARKLANGETIESPDAVPPPAGRPGSPVTTKNPRGRRVGHGRVPMNQPRPVS